MQVNRQSKFNLFLCDWMRFDDGTYVLSAELYQSKEDFGDWPQIEKDFKAEEIGVDRVRFACQGSDFDNGEPACMWWLGATDKKGSKPVWTYRLKYLPKPKCYQEFSKTIALN